MRSLPLLLAFLLIVFLSWQAGGTAEETRLLGIIAAGAIFIVAAVLAALRPDNGLRRDSSFFIPIALLLAATVGVFASPAPAVARSGGWEISAGALLLASFLILPPPLRALSFFRFGLILCGIALIAAGLLRGMGKPLSATFINRNHFCAFLGIILPLALAPALRPGRGNVRTLFGLLSVILAGGMIMTRSRGGLVALCITLLFFWGMERRRRGWSVRPILIAGLLASVLLVLALGLTAGLTIPSPILHPLSSILHPLSPTLHPPSSILPRNEISVSTRLSLMRSTFSIFLSRPLFGWGWGTFQFVYPRFKEPGIWYTVSHAHNEWIEIAAEGGSIGFVLIAFAGGLLFRRLSRAGSAGENGGSLFALGASGSLVYALAHSCFDFIFRIPAVSLLLAAMAGAVLSLGKRATSGIPVAAGFSPRTMIIHRSARRALCLIAGGAAGFLLILPSSRSLLSLRARERGFRLLEEGRIEHAGPYFSRAHALDPRGYLPLYGLARVEIARFGRDSERLAAYARILDLLERARENNPWETRTGWTLAGFRSRLGNNAAAEEALRETASLDPSNPFLALARARLRLREHDSRGAAALLREASENYLSIWPAALSLLIARVKNYSVLQELASERGDFRRDLGYALLAARRPEEARQEAARAAEVGLGNPSNWLALGRIAAADGRIDEARDAYRQALSLAPGDAVAWSELGDLHLRRNEEEEALICFLAAVALSPRGLGPARSAGRLLSLRRGTEAAAAFWETVSRRNPESGYPHYARAEIFAKKGEANGAREAVSRALELEPGNPHFLLLQKKLEKSVAAR